MEVRSDHFRVLTDAGEPRGIELARRLEQTRAVMLAVLGEPEREPPPLRVLAFRNRRGFTQLLPAYESRPGESRVGGAFLPGTRQDTIALRLDAPEEQPGAILRHELLHALVYRRLPPLPSWLSEGMAELWSVSALEGPEVRIGLAHRRHLELLDRQGLLPVAELRRGRPVVPAGSPALSRFYATAWALCHLLVTDAGDGASVKTGAWPSRLETYVSELRRGVEEPRAWELAFGSVASPKEIDRRLRSYVRAGRFDSLVVETPARARPAAALRRLVAAEVEAAKGDLLVEIGQTDGARAHLELALDEAPDQPLALEAMGHLHALEGCDDRAIDYLARAVETGQAAPLAYSRLVGLMLRRRPSSEAAAQAERILQGLTAEHPELAVAWIELAAVYAGTDPTFERTLAMCRRAVEVEPRSGWYRLLLARAELRSGRRELALATARQAARLAVAEGDVVSINNVCWYGGVGGLATAAAAACDEAVRLRPERGWYRDSRALVRALNGDLAGGLEDLRFFLSSADAQAGDPEIRSLREAWLERLEGGESPFDEATLAELSDLPF